MASDTSDGNLTYREQDVDERLDEHDRRISRLEKASLIVLGYGIAEGSSIIETLAALVI